MFNNIKIIEACQNQQQHGSHGYHNSGKNCIKASSLIYTIFKIEQLKLILGL